DNDGLVLSGKDEDDLLAHNLEFSFQENSTPYNDDDHIEK
ncbi:hypothetical protein NPIL_9781, partial [Nephila pilipes]